MQTYIPPIDDYKFLLTEVLGFDRAMGEMGKEVDADLAVAVLDEAGKMCAERLQPLNREGDEQGSRLIDGVVHTPEGYAEAYREFVAAGWASLSGDPAHGGQGLPFVLQLWLDEMISATNLSFGLFPGLTRGACEAIAAHASEELKARYLAPLVTGEWTGAMALTESGAGTDLALLKTRATPNGDDSYAVQGTKIFISSGDHDFGGNIVHLVLARLPDAPAGVKGISLFLVPKFLPDAAGKPGARNTVKCGSIEHKMGIHGNSTCVMNYDNATGWLIGEENKGMQGMFVMMNEARLGVGLQGLAISEAAYQSAASYARERIQGRSLTGPKAPEKKADPIIVHPDVRRTLMQIRSINEAGRAFTLWTALKSDIAHRSGDAAEKQLADDVLGLMTPILKGVLTDKGFDHAVMAQQVYGGHGYIEEWGMSQYVRDARIAMIYEGANGIQALDLVGRKLGLNGGRAVMALFKEIGDFCEENRSDENLAAYTKSLKKGLNDLQASTMWFMQNAMAKPDNAGAGSTDYMHLFGLVVLGYMWAKMAKAANENLAAGSGDADYYKNKLLTGRFYMEKVMPETALRKARIETGADSLMEMAAEAF